MGARFMAFMHGATEDSFASITNFLVILFAHLAARYFYYGNVGAGSIMSAAAICCLIERRYGRLLIAPLAALTGCGLFSLARPALGNHGFLELVLLGCVALSIPLTARKATSVAGVTRWLCVILFSSSGLQKIFYGAYFGGSFLARLTRDDRFGWFLDLTLPQHELARLAALNISEPHFLISVSGIVVSNGIYLSEIACAVLLIIPATRKLGMFAGILVLLSVEVVAREWGFGVSALMMLFLFRPALLKTNWILVFPIIVHIGWAIVWSLYPGYIKP